MEDKSDAPWTADQVASLNAYQECGYAHPFTSGSGGDLIATPEGWVEQAGGPIVQTWAHPWMVDWRWRIDWLEARRASV